MGGFQPKQSSFVESAQGIFAEIDNYMEAHGQHITAEERNLTFHAIIVGIDTYDGNQRLRSASNDAKRMAALIKSQLNVHEENISLLLNELATSEAIVKCISDLIKKAKRNDAILFYFSGLSGVEPDASDDSGAYICTADFSISGALSDETLVYIFDQISKSCGNNIVSDIKTTSMTFDQPGIHTDGPSGHFIWAI